MKATRNKTSWITVKNKFIYYFINLVLLMKFAQEIRSLNTARSTDLVNIF